MFGHVWAVFGLFKPIYAACGVAPCALEDSRTVGLLLIRGMFLILILTSQCIPSVLAGRRMSSKPKRLLLAGHGKVRAVCCMYFPTWTVIRGQVGGHGQDRAAVELCQQHLPTSGARRLG